MQYTTKNGDLSDFDFACSHPDEFTFFKTPEIGMAVKINSYAND